MDEELYLTALHEAGHAIVAKAVGHSVHHIHVEPYRGPGSSYCDSGARCDPDGAWIKQTRALVALGGYFATAVFGRARCKDVSDWDVARDDRNEFESKRCGMSFRHARVKVMRMLRDRREQLLALTERLYHERDVKLDPMPADATWSGSELTAAGAASGTGG